jgi:hypothetical protein
VNWLFPGFLAGSLLIGLPVVLHLLRRKPRVVVRFPTLRFLGETALRDTRRHQLRRWLILLLRCAAIVLLAAAFARPFWGNPAATHRRAMVLAVDNSMSMQSRGRWEDSRRWALEQLNELHPGDQAALLLMHPEPVWLVPATDDLTRVRTALQSAQPGFEKTRYAKPLRLAGETLARLPAQNRMLVWMADEQSVGWRNVDLTQKLPPGVTARFAGALPAPQRQAAIIALRKSNDPNGGLDITIRQFHAKTDQRRLTVRAGERVLAEKTLSLNAGDNKTTVTFAWPADVAGLRVALDADDLPADDSAWIATATTATNRVFLDATTETDFLAHALRSTQKLNEPGFQPAPLPEGDWPADAVVILRKEAAFQGASLERLNRFVESGGAVWVFADGSAAQSDWLKHHGVGVAARKASAAPWHLRDWDAEHPALAAFAGQSLLPLLEVEFYSGVNLSGDALASLANWPDGKMALAEVSRDGWHIFVAGFAPDREAMNWPTKPSFVPFVHCAVRWLSSVKDAHEDWRVGDVIPLPGGPGVWRALDSPVKQADQSVTSSVRPPAPGLYEFTGEGVRKHFAVNVPMEESDLSPWPSPDQLAALESKNAPAPEVRRRTATLAERQTVENRQRIWWWLLAMGGLALLVELGLANRTSL